jgi:hypothetical protein
LEKKYADKISHMEKVLERIDFNESYTDGCVRRQRALEGFMDDTNTYASPEFAFYYYEEVKDCYINGHFIACIIMCQLVCSEMLKWHYRVAPGNIDFVNQAGFDKLIERALSDQFISKELADKLHTMRKFRNSLEHTKDYDYKDMDLLGFRIRYESEEIATEYVKLTVVLKESLSWGGAPRLSLK